MTRSEVQSPAPRRSRGVTVGFEEPVAPRRGPGRSPGDTRGVRLHRYAAGLLAFCFYAVHGGYHVLQHHPEDLLWSCHVANVLIGIGLIGGLPLLNAIACQWLALGVPLWLLDLATGGEFHATSLLTHVGGLCLSLYGVKTRGVPPHAWWKALGSLLALQQLCRWITPPESNVNLAFGVWRGWESRFPSYALYWLLLLAASGGVFLLVEKAARRLSPVRTGRLR